jgi:polysaccharide chain length determinant protein (PEP-CTERM system associated)
LEQLLSPTAILGSLRRGWWFIVLGLIVGSGLAYESGRRLPKVYRASTLILVEPQKIPAAYVRPTVTASIADRLRTLRQQITSRTRIERVISDLNLFPDQVGVVPMDRLVASVVGRLGLEVRGTSTFRITFQGGNPKVVAAVANRAADLFIEENLAARQRQASGTSAFLDGELKRVRQKLETDEDALARFKQIHVGELPEQRETNLRTLDALQARRRTNNEALARAQDRRVNIEGQLDGMPSAAGDVNLIARQLEQEQTKLQELLSKFTEKHPDVVQQRRDIESLQAQLSAQPQEAPDPNGVAVVSPFQARLRTDLATIETEIRTLEVENQQIKDDSEKYRARVENAPRNEAVLSRLTRDIENMRANYRSLLNKRLDAELAEKLEHELQGEQFNVVDRALPPSSHFKPNLMQIVGVGSAIGTLISLMLVLIWDLLKPRFRTEQELAAAFGIPVLATVPLLSTELTRTRHKTIRRFILGSGVLVAVLGALIAAYFTAAR